MTTSDRVLQIVTEHFGEDAEHPILADTTFDQLQADELDKLEIIITIEEVFGIQLGEADEDPATLGALICRVEEEMLKQVK